MAVYSDCRHYVMQTVGAGEKLERCRLGANENLPFACPEGCLFLERRNVSGAGWNIGEGGPRRNPPEAGPGGSARRPPGEEPEA